MVALDASMLAYAVNRYAPEHPRAARVVEDLAAGERPWALPWPAVHEFLSLVTHPHAVARPLGGPAAWDFVARLLESPAARPLAPTSAHPEVLAELLATGPASAGPPPGLELAAVLREHGVRELLSADRGMRRYGFLTVVDPLRDEAWSPASAPARRYRVLRRRTGG